MLSAHQTRELVLNVGPKVVNSEKISVEDHGYNSTSPNSLSSLTYIILKNVLENTMFLNIKMF